MLKAEITRVFEDNYEGYGVRKVWRQWQRKGFDVARCTVDEGFRIAVIRGKPLKTTISNKAEPWPLDHVNRQFNDPAPNILWMSDFAHVSS